MGMAVKIRMLMAARSMTLEMLGNKMNPKTSKQNLSRKLGRDNFSEKDLQKYYSFIRGVLGQLAGHYVELSKQKYSSNVVEKSIANSVLLKDNTIFDELLSLSAISQLLDNHFGTYVLQKTLQSLPRDRLKEIDTEVKGSRNFSSGHGQNLLSKWKQILSKAM